MTKPGGGEHHAGTLCGVAEQRLEVLRDEHGGAEEDHAKDELEEDGGAEVAVFEQAQVYDGVWVTPLPDDEGGEEDGGGDGDEADHGVAEPVFFLAFIEEKLHAADAGCDEGEAGEIDGEFDFHALLHLRWVFDHLVREPEREDADGDVDEEDPVPVVVIGDPATERGADGGGDDDGHAVECEGLAAIGDGEGIGEDGLLRRGEAAAAEALQDARKDEQRQRGCEAAEQRAEGEDRDAGHVKALTPDAVGEPARDGQDNGGADEVAGENPGGFFLRGADGACDVGQGDVGDGGIKHLHKGGEGDGERDGPLVVAGAPLGFRLFSIAHYQLTDKISVS